MLDPATRDDASRLRLEIDPVDGATLERVVGEVFSASPAVVARARELIAPN